MSQGLGRQFDSAQRAYDARMPEDDDAEDGECAHKWKPIPGGSKDGTRFVRCTKCGKTEEV